MNQISCTGEGANKRICYFCGTDWRGEKINWYRVAGEDICSICWLKHWEDPTGAVRERQRVSLQKGLFD